MCCIKTAILNVWQNMTSNFCTVGLCIVNFGKAFGYSTHHTPQLQQCSPGWLSPWAMVKKKNSPWYSHLKETDISFKCGSHQPFHVCTAHPFYILPKWQVSTSSGASCFRNEPPRSPVQQNIRAPGCHTDLNESPINNQVHNVTHSVALPWLLSVTVCGRSYSSRYDVWSPKQKKKSLVLT